MEKKEYENNIVYDSYYLVNLFEKDGKKVTQLQVQKLMYFFEAYYMILHNNTPLYDCFFKAWNFGPVAIPLYNEYKVFGQYPIQLIEFKKNVGNTIKEEKQRVMESIYEVFKDITPEKLVGYTHMQDSPWTKVWNSNDKKITSGEASNIDKLETAKWFRKHFIE